MEISRKLCSTDQSLTVCNAPVIVLGVFLILNSILTYLELISTVSRLFC